jgi:hypothetical protein
MKKIISSLKKLLGLSSKEEIIKVHNNEPKIIEAKILSHDKTHSISINKKKRNKKKKSND